MLTEGESDTKSVPMISLKLLLSTLSMTFVILFEVNIGFIILFFLRRFNTEMDDI